MMKFTNAGSGGPGYATLTVSNVLNLKRLEVEVTGPSRDIQLDLASVTALHKQLGVWIRRNKPAEPKKLYSGTL